MLVEKAISLVDEARKKSITLRILGAIAIKIHSPHHSYIQDKMGRTLSDIDLAGLSKQYGLILQLLESLGYKIDKRILFKQADRIVADHLESKVHVDVFFDKINMCHTIDLRNRLEVDYPTISVTDLLLEKLQIVKIAEKDLIDLTTLIAAHALGSDDNDKINIKYIADIVRDDWGFYYTIISNLSKLREYVKKLQIFQLDQKEEIVNKIDNLIDVIENTSKSMKWKLRAKIGPSMKWYREVEDLYR
jgi:hypothetical protein